jgi:hypothetical protein
MTRMLVMVPSRERPANVARFAAAAQATITGRTDVMFVFDDGDPELRPALRRTGRWDHEVRPRTVPGAVAKLNACAMDHLDYGVLMFADDDCIPRTRGWDQAITAAIEAQGGTGMAYPERGGRTDVPELVAISSDIVAALGWFAPPAITHYWCDGAWADLGSGAGCLRYVPEAVLEHMHHTFGKGERDHIYALGEQFFHADRAALEAWRRDGLQEALAAVRACQQKRKEAVPAGSG